MKYRLSQVILLTSLLSISFGSLANDCSILSTGKASELAVDDPDRFEYLTKICNGENTNRQPAPRDVIRRNDRDNNSWSDRRKRGSSNRFVNDEDAQKPRIGCEFLFHPVPKALHPINKEACKKGENLVCKLTGKGAHWEKGGTACTNSPKEVEIYELNTRDLFKLNQQPLFD